MPFSYRALMSGVPQLCSSLVSHGFNDDSPDCKTQLSAIRSDFELGYARWKKFFAIGDGAPDLVQAIDETQIFMEAHRNRYMLLETIELDIMSVKTDQGLRACVERELTPVLARGPRSRHFPLMRGKQAPAESGGEAEVRGASRSVRDR